jgi:ATP-dependent Clp protease ATP-binding subunit ClpX
MLDIMYELPTMENVRDCLITAEVILKQEEPIIIFHGDVAKTG